jgi:hypothetical protein
MPPPGGPPDTTPPHVLWTRPPADTTGVDPSTRIRIAFSERMDRRSVERAVFVSPRFTQPPDLKWRGRELEILPPEGLRADRTYLVTLGAECADEARNRMRASHSFAFGTGAELNRGRIEGSVQSGTAGRGQTYVWAFDRADGTDPEPSAQPPAYVTQPGEDGGYAFPRLGPGRYRLFAFTDSDGSRDYTPGKDPLAVPPGDVVLQTGAERLRLGPLRTASRDTAGPRLVSARTPDGAHILLRFDEPVVLPAKVPARSAGGELGVQGVYHDPEDSSRVWMLTATQDPGVTYEIDVSGFTDVQGNVAVAQPLKEVRGDGERDRRKPDVARADPGRPARFVDPGAALTVVFSEAMNPDVPPEFWVASDTTTTPEGTFSWTALNSLRFVPSTPWAAGERFRLVGRAEALSDIAGNACADSLVFEFTVRSEEGLGSISGAVERSEHRIELTAFGLDEPNATRGLTVEPGDSTYSLVELPPGLYRIWGFEDRDGDAVWNPGVSAPFVPAEPVVHLADTVSVRARWETVADRRLAFGAVDSVLAVEGGP